MSQQLDHSRPSRHSHNNAQRWPKWKRECQIWMIAVHSMVSTFMAAGIIPAYEKMTEQYRVTVHEASYLTSSQILVLGIAPLAWGPISSRYGHYPVSLFSVFGSMICNIGGARCTNFGVQITTRVLAAFLISPNIGIGGGIITELAAAENRAEKLGYWTLLTVIGTPTGPLIMGFVVQHLGVSWVYWIFAILNFAQLIAYIILGEETRHLKPVEPGHFPQQKWGRAFHSRLAARSNIASPLSVQEFMRPFSVVVYPRILIPAVAHAIIFCYANISIVVEMPITFGGKFNLDPQQVGLQFIAVIIGSVVGEHISGPASDYFIQTLKNRHVNTYPADRLWLFYLGITTVFAGLLSWGFLLQDASTTWNVTPLVGAAIAGFGNQIQTTTLLAFAVDSHSEQSAAISMFTNLCRLVYGFTGPFYFPPMFDSLNFSGAMGVMCAIIAGSALLPVVAIHFLSRRAVDR